MLKTVLDSTRRYFWFHRWMIYLKSLFTNISELKYNPFLFVQGVRRDLWFHIAHQQWHLWSSMKNISTIIHFYVLYLGTSFFFFVSDSIPGSGNTSPWVTRTQNRKFHFHQKALFSSVLGHQHESNNNNFVDFSVHHFFKSFESGKVHTLTKTITNI